MSQLPLFDAPSFAQARHSDPATSHEAASRHEQSGKAQSHRQQLLEAVHFYPGKTSAELAVLCSLERHEAARRLSDLERAMKVKKGSARRCSINGTSATEWWPR
jgi:hypothetical protein